MSTIRIDASRTVGKMKIMHAVNNVPTGNEVRCAGSMSNYKYFEEAGIPYCRSHDAGLYDGYCGEYAVDVLADARPLVEIGRRHGADFFSVLDARAETVEYVRADFFRRHDVFVRVLEVVRCGVVFIGGKIPENIRNIYKLIFSVCSAHIMKPRIRYMRFCQIMKILIISRSCKWRLTYTVHRFDWFNFSIKIDFHFPFLYASAYISSLK